MPFADLLYKLPTARLRQIVRRRATGLRPLPRVAEKQELAKLLAGVLSYSTSIDRALYDTTLAEVHVLTWLTARGGTTPFADLVSTAGEHCSQAIAQAIDGLESLGLAFWIHSNGSRSVFVPNAVRQVVPVPSPLAHPVPEAYTQYDFATLKLIAQALAAPPAPDPAQQPNDTVSERPTASAARRYQPDSRPPKAQIASAIARVVTDPSRIALLVGALSTEARMVWSMLLDQDGDAYTHHIAASLDSRQRNQLMSYGWTTHWSAGKPRNAVEELLGKGLAILDTRQGWGRIRLVVPHNILEAATGAARYRDIIPARPEWETMSAEKAGIIRHPSLIRDVACLLGFVGRTEVVRTGSGNMHRNAIKLLARGLTIPHPTYAGFIYTLARDAGLIAPSGRKRLYDLTSGADRWLGLDPESQVHALYRIWKAQPSWLETRTEPMRDERAYVDRAGITAVRDAATSLLSELAKEHPDALASLTSVTTLARHGWWRRFSYGSRNDESAGTVVDLEDVPSNYELIRRICEESLFWLGVTELSGDLRFVRLSPRGRRILLGEDDRSPSQDSKPVESMSSEVVSQFSVQPNLEVYAPPNLSASVLHRLFRVTEPSDSGMMKLNRDSIRRALDRGESTHGLLQFLKEHSRTGIPQNVQYMFNEIGGRHGHVRIGQAGLYLQVSDPALLQEIKSERGLKIRFRRELGDTIALITGDSVDAVLKQLRQAGYFPVADEDKTPDPEEDEGQVYRQEWSSSALDESIPSIEVDGRIDWDAIARMDGIDLPAHVVEPKADRVIGVENVIGLLDEAIRDRSCVEIRYEKPDTFTGTTRVIEPVLRSDWLVNGYCRLRQSERVFNTRYIRWAQVTGETF